jgi:competence ComEA-like helix-hairpin-helix protein
VSDCCLGDSLRRYLLLQVKDNSAPSTELYKLYKLTTQIPLYMALFSFGKKDKKPSEVSAPVAKTPPNPPKIQTPPGSGPFPAVKPPQPTGLMPSTAMPAGTATTQPMSMPRTGGVGLKPSRPGVGQSTRSTQRIVLPTPPGAKSNNTKSLPAGAAAARINLPIGMILRCLPPEVLADELSKFEANGKAATEIGLPMHMILGQLPSGKVEIPLQDLVAHFPAGYLQPTESIASYLPILINLPLMDVVMRIPPDLLALRPDQKDVDASVINMADPFTEEILREQAETARRQSQTNIIDESQVPQEEFVPRDQAGPAKSVAPPRRPTVEPLIPSRMSAAATTIAAPPMPPVAKLPTPPMSSLRGSPAVPPAVPAPTSRNLTPSGQVGQVPPPGRSPSGQIQVPTRSTTVMPARPQVPAALQVDTTPLPPSAAPVPPVPRHTGPIPAPPPPRHTTTLPVPRRTGNLSQLGQAPVAVQAVAPEAPASAEQTAEAVASGTPDAGADDLQRLAALAMAQLGDSSDAPATSELPAEVPPTPEPVAAPAPEVEAPAPAMVSETAPISAPAPTPAPAPVFTPAPLSATVPVSVPVPAFASSRISQPPPVVSPEPAVTPEALAETSSLPPRPVAPTRVEPEAPVSAPAASPASVAFNLNTCTAEDLVQNIPGCFQDLAESIIRYRTKIGSFKKVEELLDVPGITKDAYTNLTGEAPPNNQMPLTLNELLGFPATQHISLKDVTDRIACWPDVTGCVLSQSSGLSLVGTVPEGVEKSAIVAFAPRMFESINKSFLEVSGRETDALVIPSSGTSFHLFRSNDLYLIIMSRLPQMPERHVKVARFVLAALGSRRD